MVFFFTCSDPQYVVYMGKDKFENDELMKYGFPEDIWFHVDSLSSAHVYLRLPAGSMDLAGLKDKAVAKQKLLDMIASVPAPIVNEMCQLTKANSIDGCKLERCDVVYTPFLNLRKDVGMDTGSVGFKDEAFRTVTKCEKDKEIIKILEKTRTERKVDFVKEKEQRDEEERMRRRKNIEADKLKEKEDAKKSAEEKELKSYTTLQTLEMSSNAHASKTGTLEECREIEEDFM
mmetsp:Transcript_51952/g.137209  ORF Transcript_51952/g.137209 Transcript_51952/m.137209 type:complete len:232 (+) Transcript_51952:2-697(+)